MQSEVSEGGCMDIDIGGQEGCGVADNVRQHVGAEPRTAQLSFNQALVIAPEKLAEILKVHMNNLEAKLDTVIDQLARYEHHGVDRFRTNGYGEASHFLGIDQIDAEILSPKSHRSRTSTRQPSAIVATGDAVDVVDAAAKAGKPPPTLSKGSSFSNLNAVAKYMKDLLSVESEHDRAVYGSGSQRYGVSEASNPHPNPVCFAWKKAIRFWKEIVKTNTWHFVCMTAAIINAVICGLQADAEVRKSLAVSRGENTHTLDDWIRWCSIVQIIFVGWLTIEVFGNFLALRKKFFLSYGWRWNVFDLLIWIFSVLELLMSEGGIVSAWKVLRIMRAGKIVQAVRFLKFFHGLQKMLLSLSNCFTTLFWAFFVMFTVIYVFTIVFLNLIAGYIEKSWAEGDFANSPQYSVFSSSQDQFFEVEKYYGGFDRVALTLFRGITGSDWTTYVIPVIDAGGMVGMVWVAYIAFMIFGVLNILTGIFVDTAVKAAESDCTIAIEEQLQSEQEMEEMVTNMFEHLDSDDSGLLNEEEFQQLVDNKRMQAHLKSIGIEIHKAKNLFKLLDSDGSGTLSLPEVIEGLKSLQGGAKAAEVFEINQTLKYLSAQLHRRFPINPGHAHAHAHSVAPEQHAT
mmetsp:Transcript_44394/g.95697  ORF Transcript_44394/g.95697 Transcript_44394/m.95697 type:complete len:625 (+) Transcript_44394:88-1962(+)